SVFLDPITIAPSLHWLLSTSIAAARFWTRCVALPRPQRDGSHGTFEVYARMAAARRSRGGGMWIGRWGMRRAVAVVLGSVVAAGCTTLGPDALDQTRLHYNEVIKRTTEEQLLLNIIHFSPRQSPVCSRRLRTPQATLAGAGSR